MCNEQQQTYNWIMSIIDSCNNTFHFEAVNRIIDLYMHKYKDMPQTTHLLLLHRATHFNNVHILT
jgi:hypothetical protein